MRLFLITVLLLFQQPNPASLTEKSGGDKRLTAPITTDEKRNVSNSNPIVFIGECLGCFQESTPAHDEKKANAYDPRNDALYRRYLLFTIIGVCGGLVGILVIIWQTIQIRRSAIATRDSVRLQEAGLTQWTAINDWKVELKGNTKSLIEVNLKVGNGTNAPLLLDGVHLTIAGGDHGAVSVATWLIPKKDHPVSFLFRSTPEQLEDFANNKLVLSVKCSVFYRDSLGRHWRQVSDAILGCGPVQTRVHEVRTTVFDSTTPDAIKVE